MANKKDVTREHTLQFRVNEEELQIIQENSNQIGLTTSNFMRMVCLGAKVTITVDPLASSKSQK